MEMADGERPVGKAKGTESEQWALVGNIIPPVALEATRSRQTASDSPSSGSEGSAAASHAGSSQGSSSTVPAAGESKSGGTAGPARKRAGERRRDDESVLGKRAASESGADCTGSPDSGSGEGDKTYPSSRDSGSCAGSSGSSMKERISRLARDNKILLTALSKSQEEVQKLKRMVEQHEKQSKGKSDKTSQGSTRYWTDAEHQRFLDALQTLGPKDVKAISQHVGSRSATQVRTHAQKYFLKLARMKKSAEDAAKHGKAHGAWWLEAFNQMNPSASPSAEPSSSGEDARKRHDAGADDRKGGGVSMLAAMGGFRSADSSGGGISSGSGMHAAGWGGHVGSSRWSAEERAERVELVGREWQGVGAGVGAAGADAGGGAKVKSMTLSSSSNEESGITDGSSTHGNGTSEGKPSEASCDVSSWNETGSDKQSLETESSKDPNSVSNTNSDGSRNASNHGSGSDGANASDGGSEGSGESGEQCEQWDGSEAGSEGSGSNERQPKPGKKGGGSKGGGKGGGGKQAPGGGGSVAILNLVA